MAMLKYIKKFTCFRQLAIEVSTDKGQVDSNSKSTVQMLLVESLAGGMLDVPRENNFSELMKYLFVCLIFFFVLKRYCVMNK